MGIAKKLAVGVGVICLAAVGVVTWAKSATAKRLSQKVSVHEVTFPIPFPLSERELEQLKAEAGDGFANLDFAVIAQERALKRGKYLVEARYSCAECHGANFGGGLMVDEPPIMTAKGKNITRGNGSVVLNYTPSDWDRTVRHGILPNGRLTIMPSTDFLRMSDQELSDIIVYVRSMPPVDNTVPEVTYGPIGNLLIGSGKVPLSGEEVSHHTPHPVWPPAETAPDYGRHVTQVCAGCHGPTLTGGPIIGGPPDWPPAKNLTPHADGLHGWTQADFNKALRQGVGKSGQKLRTPMDGISKFAEKMSDRDLEAMFTYLQSLPPTATPN